MTRLIDADKLIPELEKEVKLADDWKTAHELFNVVKYFPTVEERPKGEWKCFIGSAYYGVDEDSEPIWRERKIYSCSRCNRRTVVKENFCPNCGAEMEAET